MRLASGDAMTTLPELRIARDLPTLRDLTTDKLREAIMAQRFKPGQHLVERDLCEQTGVSRSSVREALRHLEAEGLVERRGNRGLFVASITPDEARQIYEVRAAIEPEMARLFAARATDGRPRGAVTPPSRRWSARAARASSPTMCGRSMRSSTR